MIRFRDGVNVLVRRRELAAGCFAATVGLALLVTVVTPRRFTSSTRVEIFRRPSIELRAPKELGGPGNRDDDDAIFVATQVAALESRDLAERVIRRHGLASEPAFFASTAARREPLSGGAPQVDGVDPALLDRYAGYLSVRQVRGTRLIEVSFTTPSPALSAFLAAEHTEAFLEADEERRHFTERFKEGFLALRIEDARAAIKRAEGALKRFGGAHPDVVANQEQHLIARRIAELSARLATANEERLTFGSQRDLLTSDRTRARAYLLEQPAVQSLRFTLLDLRATRAGLDSRLGPDHPEMAAARAREAEVAQELEARLAAVGAAVANRDDAARANEDHLERKLAELEKESIEHRETGTRYDLLKLQADEARSLHASLVEQRREAGVRAELPSSNARLLDVPEIPARPSRPNVLLNLALGLVAGVLLGAAAAFVRDFFGRSFRSSEETQAVLRCPTLAIVPSFERHQDDLVVVRAPRSEGAEAFRGLRTALVSDPDRAPKVVVVTSARPGEGKTVASLNLAATLADSGARVLLVDANLYRPACHVALGVANRCGLSSYLRGVAGLDAAIQRLDAPRIAFLPAGPAPPSPGALIGSFRMRRLVAALRHEYDFVVLDAPPVLPVTDAVVLAHESDGVVLVVRGDDTPRAAVEVARDRLALTAVPILGVIVNHVDRGWTGLYPSRARDADGPSPAVVDSA